MSTSLLRQTSALVAAAAASLSLTGCAIVGTSNSAKATSLASAPGAYSGVVHGGQQPVVGAVMNLWAAGAPATGGSYGAGATLLGSTTTGGDGSFTFNTAGVSPCTTGQLLYITSRGGNTGAGSNTQAAMMTGIPTPCNAATGGTNVWINEVTTVAAVTALQQFMSINPAATGTVKPWTIGAPSTNLVGMTNAFAGLPQLVNSATGLSANSSVSNTVASVLYTTTITVDATRINTVADILATCVNSTGGATCTSLFADVTPGSAGTPTVAAPIDTIQAAYDILTNPGGLTMNAHGQANSPTYLCNQYISGTTAFLPALTCGTNTNDWLIGVKWQTVNASAVTVGTIDAASVAIDGNGNIWTGAGTGVTTNIVNQFNPTGQIVMAPVSTVNIPAYNVNYVIGTTGTPMAYAGSAAYTLGYGRPFGLAIDTNNNAWFNAYGAVPPGTLTNGSTVLPTGVIAQVTPTGTANGFIVPQANGALAIDGANNIFLSGTPVVSPSVRYFVSMLSAADNFQTLYQGNGRGTAIYNDIFMDGTASQYAWAFGSYTACPASYAILHTNAAQEIAQTTTTGITDTTGCAQYGAADAAGNAWVTASGNLYYVNIAPGTATPVVTTVTGSTNGVATAPGGTGGLDNPTGVAVDGAGNVWTMNRVASTVTGGLSEFAVSTNASNVTTVTPLSPGGTQAGVFGYQVLGATGTMGVQIDPSGNLWINSTSGSPMYHFFGAAVPVVTPTSLAVKNGALAIRP